MGLGSSIFPAITLLIALATAKWLAKYFPLATDDGRLSSIDGLRGYLAFLVFTHHAAIWSYYLRISWTSPSAFCLCLGHNCVSLFFMITGFLFFSKLLNSDEKPIDWTRLYVSRVMRLCPLYAFMLGALFLVVAVRSDFSLKVPVSELALNALQWCSFSVFGRPDLNGVRETFLITAGVTWTLAFEWLFYCSLPLLALSLGKIRSPYWTVFGLLAASLIAWKTSDVFGNDAFFASCVKFGGGILAAYHAKSPKLRAFAETFRASALTALCIYLAFLDSGPSATFPLIVAFMLIACGNTLFGLLTLPSARFLGEISYSVYLLHGVFLFAFFNFAPGTGKVVTYSPWQFWTLIFALTPILLWICRLTHKYVEEPPMKLVSQISDRILALFPSRTNLLDSFPIDESATMRTDSPSAGPQPHAFADDDLTQLLENADGSSK